MPTHHIPRPHERPDVEVLVGDAWCPGEVRMQTQLEVAYRLPGEHSSRLDSFTTDHVREDSADRSRGRDVGAP